MWILPAVISGVIRVGFNSVLSSTSVELLPSPLCGCFLFRKNLLFSDFVLLQNHSKRWLNVKLYIIQARIRKRSSLLFAKPGSLAVYLFKTWRTFNYQTLKLLKLEWCFLPAISYKLKFVKTNWGKKQNTDLSYHFPLHHHKCHLFASNILLGINQYIWSCP